VADDDGQAFHGADFLGDSRPALERKLEAYSWRRLRQRSDHQFVTQEAFLKDAQECARDVVRELAREVHDIVELRERVIRKTWDKFISPDPRRKEFEITYTEFGAALWDEGALGYLAILGPVGGDSSQTVEKRSGISATKCLGADDQVRTRRLKELKRDCRKLPEDLYAAGPITVLDPGQRSTAAEREPLRAALAQEAPPPSPDSFLVDQAGSKVPWPVLPTATALTPPSQQIATSTVLTQRKMGELSVFPDPKFPPADIWQEALPLI
jgi:hypothetical protein